MNNRKRQRLRACKRMIRKHRREFFALMDEYTEMLGKWRLPTLREMLKGKKDG